MSRTPRIAIVGGGFTGAAAAIELLRTLPQSFDLIVFDPDELGRGLAYGRAESFHLLNVRAGKLSVFHDRPGDFAHWAHAQSFGAHALLGDPAEPTRAFLPRRLFGAYVEARLAEELAARPDVRFTHIRSTVTSVRRSFSGYEIVAEDSAPLNAHAVILATGYGRPSESSRRGRNAFTELDPKEVRAASSALFLGSGLSFVDEFLCLRSRGFRGETVAVSRHGLLPEIHRANESPRRPASTRSAEPALAALLRVFRTAVAASDPPPSAAVDLILGMRGDLQELWQSLPLREQRRFFRHLRSYWNVARHRLPPEMHAQVRRSMQSGMLRVLKGRVEQLGEREFRIRMPGEEPIVRRFDLVFDCRGHRADIASPMILSLVRQGLARVDAHRLGVSVKPDGVLVGRFGASSAGLYALGPLGLGTLFEITAVPEIVAQCSAMAQGLAVHLHALRGRGRSAPALPGQRVLRE